MALCVSAAFKFLLTPLREGRLGRAAKPGYGVQDFYSRPCGRGDCDMADDVQIAHDFYSRPCGRGDHSRFAYFSAVIPFLLTPLREGRPRPAEAHEGRNNFYSRPCGRGDLRRLACEDCWLYFYSRPCGRGDGIKTVDYSSGHVFLLTPLREGRPNCRTGTACLPYFYSRPCGRGDPLPVRKAICGTHFYSRPCGRGDHKDIADVIIRLHFYSRPCGRGDLRLSGLHGRSNNHFYSRPCGRGDFQKWAAESGYNISTHAPAGGATSAKDAADGSSTFLLTPLREGRPARRPSGPVHQGHFYSRPCGRGDSLCQPIQECHERISTHAPAGGATSQCSRNNYRLLISTHAPAGGATCFQPLSCSDNIQFLLTPLREGRRP